MTATSPANPEQVRLPGQAHVAEGPYDQTGMYIMHHARAALLEHLRHEETDALPFLQLVVDHRENQAIEAAAKKGYPFSAMPFMVPWGVEGIPGTSAKGS